MQPSDIDAVLSRLADGQEIKVTTLSGIVKQGVYEQALTADADALHFSDLNGQVYRVAWGNIESLDFREARSLAGDRFMVPPEHPLSGARRRGAYTVRNPIENGD